MTALNPILGIEYTFENCSSNSGREMFHVAEAFYSINPQILMRNGRRQTF